MARTLKWRNTTSLLAVAALALSACGGGDDEDTDAVPAADDASDEPASEPADEPAAAESSDDGDDAQAEAVDTSDDESSGGGMTIRSIDDIPAACRDELADFLRDIEPIVGGTDWSNATLADMEAIGEEFQERAAEFDEVSAVAGCNDLNFDDDNSFELIIEYAQDEAPGTVGFLSFLNDFTTSMAESAESALGGDDGAGSDSEIDDCESGIAYVEQLMADYDNLTEAPLGEIAKLGDVAFAMMDCTPEQAEFFDRDDVADFLDG